MTERPDLSRGRSQPRPADVTGDPADPVTPTPAAAGAVAAERPRVDFSYPAPRGPQPRLAPIGPKGATVAIQYRLTPEEADILYQMQEARGDRRGIDTMRWLLATYGHDLIQKAADSRS